MQAVNPSHTTHLHGVMSDAAEQDVLQYITRHSAKVEEALRAALVDTALDRSEDPVGAISRKLFATYVGPPDCTDEVLQLREKLRAMEQAAIKAQETARAVKQENLTLQQECAASQTEALAARKKQSMVMELRDEVSRRVSIDEAGGPPPGLLSRASTLAPQLLSTPSPPLLVAPPLAPPPLVAPPLPGVGGAPVPPPPPPLPPPGYGPAGPPTPRAGSTSMDVIHLPDGISCKQLRWKKVQPTRALGAAAAPELPAAWRDIRPVPCIQTELLVNLFGTKPKKRPLTHQSPLAGTASAAGSSADAAGGGASAGAPSSAATAFRLSNDKRRRQIETMMKDLARQLRAVAATEDEGAAPGTAAARTPAVHLAREVHHALLELHPSLFGWSLLKPEDLKRSEEKRSEDLIDQMRSEDLMNRLIECLPPDEATWEHTAEKEKEKATLADWGAKEIEDLRRLRALPEAQLPSLSPPEAFVWRVLTIPALVPRLSALRLLQFQIEPQLAHLLTTLHAVHGASEQLVRAASDKTGLLAAVCGRALTLGNALNSRSLTVNRAEGFSLDGLLELQTYHLPQSAPAAFHNLTLLHYISAHILMHLPPLPEDFPTPMMARSAAARQYMSRVREDFSLLLSFHVDKVDMKALAEEMRELLGSMRALHTVMRDAEREAAEGAHDDVAAEDGPSGTDAAALSSAQEEAEYHAASWYYSNGDTSEGAFTFGELKEHYAEHVAAEGATRDKALSEAYVWGSHMAEGSEWLSLQDANAAPLLRALERVEHEPSEGKRDKRAERELREREAWSEALNYGADDSAAERGERKRRIDDYWERNFRRALRFASSFKGAHGALPGAVDSAWTAQGIEDAMQAAEEALTQAQDALILVRDTFGGRFTSGKEESVEPITQLAAVKAFIPMFEQSLHTVQHVPKLLLLVRGELSAPRWKIAMASLETPEGATSRATARAILSAWDEHTKSAGVLIAKRIEAHLARSKSRVVPTPLSGRESVDDGQAARSPSRRSGAGGGSGSSNDSWEQID